MAEICANPILMNLPASRLWEALSRHRKAAGHSLEEIAGRLDHAFTPLVLEMVESGRFPVDEPQARTLMAGYGLELENLLPARQQLGFDDEGTYMAVGSTLRELKDSTTAESVLSEYLGFVYDMRGIDPGSQIPLRDDDLEVLSNTIDWSTGDIRDHLFDLMERRPDAVPAQSEPSVPAPMAEGQLGATGGSLLERLRTELDMPAPEPEPLAHQDTVGGSLLERLRSAEAADNAGGSHR